MATASEHSEPTRNLGMRCWTSWGKWGPRGGCGLGMWRKERESLLGASYGGGEGYNGNRLAGGLRRDVAK